MSQAKVDKYKVDKANRKEIMAKEKRQKAITKACLSVVGIALVAWIGISGALAIYDARPVDKFYVTTKDVDDYVNGLFKSETEETESTEDKKDESTETTTEQK